jgi:hypothetical protein
VRFNRAFAIVVTTVILCVLAVTIPATPALAAPHLALSPASGTAGTTVTLTGDNFISYANDQIHIYFGSAEISGSPLSVPGSGKFSLKFQVPDDAVSGRSLVTVRDVNGNQLGESAPFDIPHPFIVGLSPAGGFVGTEVTVTGRGFRANQIVTFTLSNHSDIKLGEVKTSDIGECSCVFTIPESTGKEHKIIATDPAGNKAEGTLTIIPSIVINPVSGAIAETVTINGTGFGYKSRLTISLGQKQVKTTTTNTDGSFEASFEVPSMELQTYDVEIADIVGNTVTGKFTINAGEVSFVFPQWGVYALMGLGGAVLFIFGLWLGRKYAFTY